MVTTEECMFFLPLVGSDWETQKLNWKNTEFSRPQRNRFRIPRGPDSGICATLRQAEDRMAEKPDVNNLTMSEI
ncbi:MAG: hypothetical protein MUP08_09770 [Desulfobulbaceae bacterium]|nr:hypothetical protein [Desulfobulbaceae bacterium]